MSLENPNILKKWCETCGQPMPDDVTSRFCSPQCKVLASSGKPGCIEDKQGRALVKACSKCARVEVLDEFSRDKMHKDGRRSACKQCEQERSRVSKPRKRKVDPYTRDEDALAKALIERDDITVDRIATRLRMPKEEVERLAGGSFSDSSKACSKCGRSKPLYNFHHDSSTKDGRKARCKECKHEYDIQRKHGTQKEARCPAEDGRLAHQEALIVEADRRLKILDKVRDAFKVFDLRTRRILTMYFLDDRCMKDIAKILDVKIGGINTIIDPLGLHRRNGRKES